MPPQASPITWSTPAGIVKTFTATGLLVTGRGVLVGVVVSNHSSGTLQFADSLTITTPQITDTITLAATERWIPFFGATFAFGLYVTVGGTGHFTAIYN